MCLRLGGEVKSLVHLYASSCSPRGSDVAILTGTATAKLAQINPYECECEDVLAYEWCHLGEHIKVYEMCAYLLSLKWRTCYSHCLGSKFLHLVDSLVSLDVIAKGCTVSRLLKKVFMKFNAVWLANRLSPPLGYSRGHRNPADDI